MEDLWTAFCGASNCSDGNGMLCGDDLAFKTLPFTCINHALIVCCDVLLLIMLIFTMFYKTSLKSRLTTASVFSKSSLRVISAVYNGLLGLIYLSLGIWIVEEKLRNTRALLPLHWWTVFLLHGLIWLLVGLTVSLRGQYFSRVPLRLLSILAFIFAGITCASSIVTAILGKKLSIKIVLDVLSLVGSSLLLLCTYRSYKYEDNDENDLYAPLVGAENNGNKTHSISDVTPFAKAMFISKLSFWWLNPLMKRGREKTLEDADIPKLREDDRAESCYLLFTEIFNRQKQTDPSAEPSILRTILLCHWKEILMSGFFALLKVITLSAGPLLLNAFIKVAEGKESFKNEGYVLAILLFFTKILESLSQRQWYFRSRLIGLKVRSLLTAAIYKKQLRLSNTAKLVHSSGEIMNYVTVDAYRIGEFPFWFHQTWTTSVQLCLALFILFRAGRTCDICSHGSNHSHCPL
ncbi:ABC transporter C family member 10 [Abeliophyllum distichum]|uniref:ABC transporter C family member 10 n=1 Tax=Abeliophyllum distichum TaxID=126358 RepID=A0ABD1VXT3_9LAMI